jgi:PAS domain S-box-containing protein
MWQVKRHLPRGRAHVGSREHDEVMRDQSTVAPMARNREAPPGASNEGFAMDGAGTDEAQRGGTWMDEGSAGWLELLPTPACLCDPGGRVVAFNRKAETLWGRRPAAGEPWSAAWRGRVSRPDCLFPLSQGQPVHSERLLVERPSGERVHVLVSAEPGRGGAPAVVTFQSWPRGFEELPSRLQGLLETLPAAVCTADADGLITFYNQAAAELWGETPAVGATVWCGAHRLYRPDGTPLPHDQCPLAQTIRERRQVRDQEVIVERPDGTRTAVRPHATPLFDERGAFIGAINMFVDISHEKLADQRHTLFARELNHRVKNALATVYAIAMQTLRHTDSLDVFRESFGSRLLALSRAHDLLVRSQWQETPLDVILGEALAPHGASRIELSGDPVAFGPRATLTLAMTFHELISNAVQYGSLSTAEGALGVRWTVGEEDGDRVVDLSWEERGGPPVTAPETTGFGSRLVGHNVMALGGRSRFDYAPAGLRFEMSFPIIDEGSAG